MSDDMTAVHVREVTREVTRRLSTRAADTEPVEGEEYRALARRVVRQVLDERASRALASGELVLDGPAEEAIARQVLARVCGLGPLEALLEDSEIENVNLTGTQVWVRYADGRREQLPPIVDSPEELVALVRRIAADSPTGERRFDPAAPILDMALADGSRLNAILDVSHQPAVSIRRHRYRTTGLGQLRRLGTLDRILVDLLQAAVRSRRNIVITGGTSAGKTTLLRALATEVPPEERVVTIEDVPELALERDKAAHPDAVALHSRPPNTEGRGEVTVADLVRAALRMSPDRVIVGETRGSETVPLLTAMSQGNDGSLTTLHAASSQGAFTKLGAYAALSDRLPLEATSLLVAAAVHLVVHVSATPTGGRRVTSVREVVGADGAQVISNEIYRYERGEKVSAAPPSPETGWALQSAGFDVARLVAAPSTVNGRRR
ncbi:CpaF family protein [Nocardiopsis quinghaiensis]|uniref:CpaF family protein n=1 Tax=Nocardiopsis quinghaiensis TaxID=464995 RepID=UPI001238E016|nr:ATPase, T2SS/T4P/T4SS family [Nocardiopsis quinghaiensis]